MNINHVLRKLVIAVVFVFLVIAITLSAVGIDILLYSQTVVSG